MFCCEHLVTKNAKVKKIHTPNPNLLVVDLPCCLVLFVRDIRAMCCIYGKSLGTHAPLSSNFVRLYNA